MADTTSEMNIVIKATDQASASLGTVNKELDKLGSTAQTASTQQANLGKAVFNGVAAWDMLKAGVGAVSGFVEKSIDEAREAGRAQNMLNAVLASTKGISGETSASVNELAETMQKKTGVDKEAIISGQNMLLTFTHIGKEVFPQATEAMLNMATAMNGGMKPSAEQLRNTAIQLGIALNDPTTGIARLHRVGVEFSDVQKKQIADFMKTGEVAKAQGIIINELGTEFGGAAAASKTPMDDMKNAIKDLQVGIGQDLLPVIRDWSEKLAVLVTGITDFVTRNQDSIIEVGKLIGIVVAATAAGLGLWKAFELIQAAQKAMSAGMLISPWGIAIAGAALLAAGVVYLSDKFGGFGNAMKVVGLSLQAMGEVMVLSLKQMGNQLITWMNDALQVGNNAYNFISDLLKKVGVDIGRADMKIGFQFNEQASNDALTKIGQQVNDMQTAADKVKKDAKSASDAKIKSEQDAQAKMAALGDLMRQSQEGVATGAEKTNQKAADAIKKHSDAVDKLKDEYKTLQDKTETEMASITETHKKSTESITANINKVKLELSDLATSYAKAQSDLSKSFDTTKQSDTSTAADAVVASEQKIADLKTQMASETDATKYASLAAELKKEQDAYNASADFIKSIQSDVDEARRVSTLTDLQKAIEDYTQKRTLATNEYNDKLTTMANENAAKTNQLQMQLVSYQDELTAENALYKQKVDAIFVMQDAANIQYQKGVEDNYKMTTDAVNKEIQLYQDLANAIAKVGSANVGTIGTIKAPTISGTRALGGPVSSGSTYLVGENGPEYFTPSESGSIRANGSNGGGVSVQINITGNTIAKDIDIRNLASQVSREITNVLRINQKLSV